MLVLGRKRNEQIVIGTPPDEITVKVLEIRDDKVRLGFEARRDIPIYRGEVLSRATGPKGQSS